MNTPNAVARGTYSDFRIIKTRGVVQVVLEIPLGAEAEQFIERFGLPKADEAQWVAIALMQKPSEVAPAVAHLADAEKPENPRQKIVQRAAILCADDVAFQRWIAGKPPHVPCPAVEMEVHAAKCLRDRLGVRSRSELLYSDELCARFRAIDDQFRRATGRRVA